MISASVIYTIAQEIIEGCNSVGVGNFSTNVEITMHSANFNGNSVKFAFPLHIPPVSVK